MLPVLLPSTASSVIPPPPHERSIIGGRKRSNDSVDQYPLANRNSSWDVSDDDSASTPRWTMLDDERRSQHNEREKRRRDRINDRFLLLRDAIPALKHEKPSRSLILKRAAEYIAIINHRVTQQSKIIEHLQRKNEPLDHMNESLPSRMLTLQAQCQPPQAHSLSHGLSLSML